MMFYGFYIIAITIGYAKGDATGSSHRKGDQSKHYRPFPPRPSTFPWPITYWLDIIDSCFVTIIGNLVGKPLALIAFVRVFATVFALLCTNLHLLQTKVAFVGVGKSTLTPNQ